MNIGIQYLLKQLISVIYSPKDFLKEITNRIPANKAPTSVYIPLYVYPLGDIIVIKDVMNINPQNAQISTSNFFIIHLAQYFLKTIKKQFQLISFPPNLHYTYSYTHLQMSEA